MINLAQYRDAVLRPVLLYLDGADPGQHSPAAEQLMLGTLCVESDGRHLQQLGGGPAVSLYQIEPATARDIWGNWLGYRDRLAQRVASLLAPWPPGRETQLLTNRCYAAALARQVYRRVLSPLPKDGHAIGFAVYWKAHYNTARGKGRAVEFEAAYERHVRPLYAADDR